MAKIWRHPAFPFVAPFALFMLLLLAEGWIDPDKTGAIFVLYPLKTALVLAMIVAVWRRLPPFRIRAWMGSVAVGLAAFGVWVGLDSWLPWLDGMKLSWERTGGFNPFPGHGPGVAWGLALARVAGAALVVPVMEELFWRGWLQRWLIREEFERVEIGAFEGRSFAIVTAAFALVHPQVFLAVIVGLLYGWWVVRTRSVWDVALAHGVTNFALGAYVLATGRWYFW